MPARRCEKKLRKCFNYCESSESYNRRSQLYQQPRLPPPPGPPRMPYYNNYRTGPPLNRRPWQEPSYKDHSRRRHHLDDIYLDNYDDEELFMAQQDYRLSHPYARPPNRYRNYQYEYETYINDNARKGDTKKEDKPSKNSSDNRTGEKTDLNGKTTSSSNKPQNESNDKNLKKSDKVPLVNKLKNTKEVIVKTNDGKIKENVEIKTTEMNKEPVLKNEFNTIGNLTYIAVPPNAKKSPTECSESKSLTPTSPTKKDQIDVISSTTPSSNQSQITSNKEDGAKQSENCDIGIRANVNDKEKSVEEMAEELGQLIKGGSSDLVSNTPKQDALDLEHIIQPDITSSVKISPKKNIKMNLINPPVIKMKSPTVTSTPKTLSIAGVVPLQKDKHKELIQHKSRPLMFSSSLPKANQDAPIIEEVFILEDELRALDNFAGEVKGAEADAEETVGDFSNIDSGKSYYSEYMDDHSVVDMELSDSESPLNIVQESSKPLISQSGESGENAKCYETKKVNKSEESSGRSSNSKRLVLIRPSAINKGNVGDKINSKSSKIHTNDNNKNKKPKDVRYQLQRSSQSQENNQKHKTKDIKKSEINSKEKSSNNMGVSKAIEKPNYDINELVEKGKQLREKITKRPNYSAKIFQCSSLPTIDINLLLEQCKAKLGERETVKKISKFRSKSVGSRTEVFRTSLRKIKSLNDISLLSRSGFDCDKFIESLREMRHKQNQTISNICGESKHQDYKDELLDCLSVNYKADVHFTLLTNEETVNAVDEGINASTSSDEIGSKKRKRVRRLNSSNDEECTPKKPALIKNGKCKAKVNKRKRNSSVESTASKAPRIDNQSKVSTVNKPQAETKPKTTQPKGKYTTKGEYMKTCGEKTTPLNVPLSFETTPPKPSIIKRSKSFTCEADNEAILKKVNHDKKYRERCFHLFGSCSSEDDEPVKANVKSKQMVATDTKKKQGESKGKEPYKNTAGFKRKNSSSNSKTEPALPPKEANGKLGGGISSSSTKTWKKNHHLPDKRQLQHKSNSYQINENRKQANSNKLKMNDFIKKPKISVRRSSEPASRLFKSLESLLKYAKEATTFQKTERCHMFSSFKIANNEIPKIVWEPNNCHSEASVHITPQVETHVDAVVVTSRLEANACMSAATKIKINTTEQNCTIADDVDKSLFSANSKARVSVQLQRVESDKSLQKKHCKKLGRNGEAQSPVTNGNSSESVSDINKGSSNKVQNKVSVKKGSKLCHVTNYAKSNVNSVCSTESNSNSSFSRNCNQEVQAECHSDHRSNNSFTSSESSLIIDETPLMLQPIEFETDEIGEYSSQSSSLKVKNSVKLNQVVPKCNNVNETPPPLSIIDLTSDDEGNQRCLPKVKNIPQPFDEKNEKVTKETILNSQVNVDEKQININNTSNTKRIETVQDENSNKQLNLAEAKIDPSKVNRAGSYAGLDAREGPVDFPKMLKADVDDIPQPGDQITLYRDEQNSFTNEDVEAISVTMSYESLINNSAKSDSSVITKEENKGHTELSVEVDSNIAEECKDVVNILLELQDKASAAEPARMSGVKTKHGTQDGISSSQVHKLPQALPHPNGPISLPQPVSENVKRPPMNLLRQLNDDKTTSEAENLRRPSSKKSTLQVDDGGLVETKPSVSMIDLTNDDDGEEGKTPEKLKTDLGGQSSQKIETISTSALYSSLVNEATKVDSSQEDENQNTRLIVEAARGIDEQRNSAVNNTTLQLQDKDARADESSRRINNIVSEPLIPILAQANPTSLLGEPTLVTDNSPSNQQKRLHHIQLCATQSLADNLSGIQLSSTVIQTRLNQPANETISGLQPQQHELTFTDELVVNDLLAKHVYILYYLIWSANEHCKRLTNTLYYKEEMSAEARLFQETTQTRLDIHASDLLNGLENLHLTASRNLSEAASRIFSKLLFTLSQKTAPKPITKSMLYLLLWQLFIRKWDQFASIPLIKVVMDHCRMVSTRIEARTVAPFTEEMRQILIRQIQEYNRLRQVSSEQSRQSLRPQPVVRPSGVQANSFMKPLRFRIPAANQQSFVTPMHQLQSFVRTNFAASTSQLPGGPNTLTLGSTPMHTANYNVSSSNHCYATFGNCIRASSTGNLFGRQSVAAPPVSVNDNFKIKLPFSKPRSATITTTGGSKSSAPNQFTSTANNQNITSQTSYYQARSGTNQPQSKEALTNQRLTGLNSVNMQSMAYSNSQQGNINNNKSLRSQLVSPGSFMQASVDSQPYHSSIGPINGQPSDSVLAHLFQTTSHNQSTYGNGQQRSNVVNQTSSSIQSRMVQFTYNQPNATSQMFGGMQQRSNATIQSSAFSQSNLYNQQNMISNIFCNVQLSSSSQDNLQQPSDCNQPNSIQSMSANSNQQPSSTVVAQVSDSIQNRQCSAASIIPKNSKKQRKPSGTFQHSGSVQNNLKPNLINQSFSNMPVNSERSELQRSISGTSQKETVKPVAHFVVSSTLGSQPVLMQVSGENNAPQGNQEANVESNKKEIEKKRGSTPKSNKSTETNVVASNEDSFSSLPEAPPQELNHSLNTPDDVISREQQATLMIEDIVDDDADVVLNEDPVETIDLTWIDDMNDDDLNEEMNFVFVKQEYGNVEVEKDDQLNDACMTYTLVHRTCNCGLEAIYDCICGDVWYCGRECQIKDWSSHQKVCQEPSEESGDISNIIEHDNNS